MSPLPEQGNSRYGSPEDQIAEQLFDIPCCSRCGAPLEPEGYEGDLECPNAQYPNRTKHGRYYEVPRKVIFAESLAAAIERDKAEAVLR